MRLVNAYIHTHCFGYGIYLYHPLSGKGKKFRGTLPSQFNISSKAMVIAIEQLKEPCQVWVFAPQFTVMGLEKERLAHLRKTHTIRIQSLRNVTDNHVFVATAYDLALSANMLYLVTDEHFGPEQVDD